MSWLVQLGAKSVAGRPGICFTVLRRTKDVSSSKILTHFCTPGNGHKPKSLIQNAVLEFRPLGDPIPFPAAFKTHRCING